MKWYAIQIKQVYDRPSQYRVLKDLLCSEKYGLSESQIWICGDAQRENLYQGYVFIHYEGDFQTFWNDLKGERLIDKELGFFEIPDSQMLDMMSQTYPEKTREEFNLLDVIVVDVAPWSQLYGVVIANRGDDLYEVGVKLYNKSHFLLLTQSQMHRCKSLFEVWKFKR